MAVDTALDFLERDLLSPGDRKVLSLALSEATQGELDQALADWDIEAAPLQSVLLLAYLLKMRPDLCFPPSMEPRLKGVLSYCRFQNLKLKAHFTKIARGLNEAGIPFLVLKGGAMKVYRPDFPRWMSDVDMLVHEGSFEQAESVVEGLGYVPFRDKHSTDFHLAGEKDGIADLHRFVYMATGHESLVTEDFFARASRCTVFSAEGLLPAAEDMVFIALVNLCHNLSERTSPGSVISSFFDLAYLVSSKADFDWDIVRADALKSRSQVTVGLMTRLMSRFVPGVLPPHFLEEDIDTAEAEEKCFHLLYRRAVLAPLRLEIGEFHLPTAFRTCRPLSRYVARRARYFVLKRLYAFPSLASAILGRHL